MVDTSKRSQIPVWSSKLLAQKNVLAFFTTRHGGVSPAPFDTLNLGYSSKDEPDHVTANRKRVEAAYEVDLRSLAIQVHGSDVLVIQSGEKFPADPLPEADAILSNIPGLTIPVFFADCLPIFIWDPIHKAGGVIHAGWRSTVKEVGPLSIDAMQKSFGSNPKDLLVAFGPSIGPCCFEVGLDVAEQFQKRFGNDAVRRDGTRTYVDLWKSNQAALLEKGVMGGNMELAGECTSCRVDRYFSYRRDKTKTGRMAGVLKIPN